MSSAKSLATSPDTRPIRGVELLDRQIHADARGELGVFEPDSLPFPLGRVFFIRVDDADAVRGGHANSCHELIVALDGAVTVELDNGEASVQVRLSGYRQGLWIRPGIVIRLLRFAPATTLLVCASASYEETRHFDCAQPLLLRQHLSPTPRAA